MRPLQFHPARPRPDRDEHPRIRAFRHCSASAARIIQSGPTPVPQNFHAHNRAQRNQRLEPQDHHRGRPVEQQFKGRQPDPVNEKSGLTLRGPFDPATTPTSLCHRRNLLMKPRRSPQASLTGHLVFSTLRYQRRPGAPTRLVDMGGTVRLPSLGQVLPCPRALACIASSRDRRTRSSSRPRRHRPARPFSKPSAAASAATPASSGNVTPFSNGWTQTKRSACWILNYLH